MSYSAANLTGLIEIDTGLHASLTSDGTDANLGATLARLAGLSYEPVEPTVTSLSESPRYETTFLRADVDQLHGDLEVAFQQLLHRLFEGN